MVYSTAVVHHDWKFIAHWLARGGKLVTCILWTRRFHAVKCVLRDQNVLKCHIALMHICIHTSVMISHPQQMRILTNIILKFNLACIIILLWLFMHTKIHTYIYRCHRIRALGKMRIEPSPKGSKVIKALDPEDMAGRHTKGTEINNTDKKRAPPSTHIDSLKQSM